MNEKTNFSLTLTSLLNAKDIALAEALAEKTQKNENAITLSKEQSMRLVKSRTESLKNTGRVEFHSTQSALSLIDDAFCDSPYVTQETYEEILHELIALFFEFKNETFDRVNDAELIAFMKDAFNDTCAGSTELLGSVALDALAIHIHKGGTIHDFRPDTSRSAKAGRSVKEDD